MRTQTTILFISIQIRHPKFGTKIAIIPSLLTGVKIMIIETTDHQIKELESLHEDLKKQVQDFNYLTFIHRYKIKTHSSTHAPSPDSHVFLRR